MRKVKHWLHILLTILTSGLWLPVYVILLATTEMFNRGYREGKAAGRVEKSNEIVEELELVRQSSLQGATSFLDTKGRRVIVGADGDMRFGCTMKPVVLDDNSTPTMEKIIVEEYRDRTQSRVDRFAELADRVRTVGLDQYERAEFNQLRQELSR